MAVCVLFANSLSAEEIQDYSMEEKQEMYEAAMSDEEEEVMFGMYVTLPTKPGEEVSVFDGFYANVKGKFNSIVYGNFHSVVTLSQILTKWLCEKYCRSGKKPGKSYTGKSSCVVFVYGSYHAAFYRNSNIQQCYIL